MFGTVIRKGYLDQLIRFRDKTDFIKVITGIRRCGKSVLLKQFRDHLIESGVSRDDIIYIDFESSLSEPYVNRNALTSYIIERGKNGRIYVLLDEIQRVDEWETAVNALMADTDADIYITGSNAYFLSTELSTYITGRTVEIDMLPLSFAEFMELNGRGDANESLRRYLNRGGMPVIRDSMDHTDAQDILNNINSSILLKDVVARNNVRDSSGLLNVVGYLYSETGNTVSPSSISKQLKISDKTVDGYLRMLEDSLLIVRADRYDIVGEKILSNNRKYYCTDLGIRNAYLRARVMDIEKMIENVVFLELKRRGYRVRVGKYGDSEINLVADRNGTTEYYQIAQTAPTDKVREKEVDILLKIDDNYPKTVITLNRTPQNNVKGIKYVSLGDFLLGNI